MKRILRHLFTPHDSNNHRARILHHDSLFLIIAILFATLIIIQGTQRQYPAVLGDSTAAITVADLLKYTNLQRQANGLPQLKLNEDLTHAAQLKAKDMFAKDYWAHVSPDGTTPWIFIRDSGYDYLYAGENLARGFDTSSDVVTAWMNSPEHRSNMLSPNYTDIGFAVESGTLTGTQTTLVVQEFGSPYNAEATTATISPAPAGTTQQKVSSEQPITIGDIKVSQPTSLAGAGTIAVKPFVDENTLKRNISFSVIAFLLMILAIDAIIIERKKITRVFSHNIDHMLFLLFILLAGIIIAKGVIL